MNRIIRYLPFLLVIFFLNFNCAPEDNLTEFEQNDPDPEYRLFSLLDDYPALKEPFSNLDQYEFNGRMNDMVNNNLDESQVFFRLFDDLVNNPYHPLTDSLAILRGILWRVINQDSLDTDPVADYSNISDHYFDDLADFLDDVSDSDMSLSADILAIGRKTLGYIKDNYSGIELEDEMAQMIDDMEKGGREEDEAPATLILQEMIGKMAMQGNENMWLDPDGKLRVNRDEINTEEDTDTGLGNSARGMEALLSGLSEISGDEVVKEYLFNILRDYGNISTSEINGRRVSLMFKELLENVEDYCTIGGAEYGDKSSDNFYYKDHGDRYVNSEIGTTISELLPVLTDLVLRGDRETAVINSDSYPLELLAKGLNSMDLSDETLNKLEESLYKMTRYDDKFNDRLLDPTHSSNFSAMDKLVWMLGVLADYGWQVKKVEDDLADPYDAHGRLQGEPTHGILTLNDALYSLTSLPAPETAAIVVDKAVPMLLDSFGVGGSLGPTLIAILETVVQLMFGMDLGTFASYLMNTMMDMELNVYGLAFDNPVGERVHRSAFPFKASDIQHGELPFYLSTGSIGLCAMGGNEIVGDFGTPWGGRHYTGLTLPFVYSGGGDGAFIPYCKDGLGTQSAGEWTMGFMARAAWKGQAPYYCRNRQAGQAETQDIDGHTYQVYYAANGKPSVWVEKVNPDDSSTWIYREPCNGFDPNDEYICTYKTQHTIDYYMMRVPDGNGVLHYHPFPEAGYRSRNPNKGFATGEVADAYDSASTDLNTDAGTLHLTEMVPGKILLTDGTEIPVTNADRECETHEEAVYKNIKWLLYEKKFILGMPIGLGINPNPILGIQMTFNACAWILVEANGVIGLLTCQKAQSNDPANLSAIPDANGKWSRMSAVYPLPDIRAYGDENADSYFPGDSKFNVWLQGGNGIMDLMGLATINISTLMDCNVMYNRVLGSAGLLLPIVTENMGSMRHLLFLNKEAYDNVYDIPSVACGPTSRHWQELGWSSENSPYWEDRNALLPIMAALLGTCHDNAKLSTDINDKTTYPKSILAFKTAVQGLLPILAKPLLEYQKSGAEPINCWKPLIEDETIPGHITAIESACFIPGPYLDPTYYPPVDNTSYSHEFDWADPDLTRFDPAPVKFVPQFKHTLFTLVSDSDPENGKRCDGYMALPYGVANNVLALFKEMGSSKFDDPSGSDPDDYTTWGARKKIFYGIEQILTSIKPSKASAEILTRGYLNGEEDTLAAREWLFAENGTRPEDILLDEVIEDVVGYDATAVSDGKGIANYPDGKTAEDWDEYLNDSDEAGEFVSNYGSTEGKYNIMENLINVLDQVLGSVDVTDEQAAALRHTMGIVFTMYNESTGEWEYPNDLDTLTMDELPHMMRVYQGYNREFLTVMTTMLKEDGFLEFLMTSMKSPSYSSREVLTQLYDFLGDDVISRYDSSLWADLVELLGGFADMMDSGSPGWPDDLFNSNDGVKNANPYEGLGELLSK